MLGHAARAGLRRAAPRAGLLSSPSTALPTAAAAARAARHRHHARSLFTSPPPGKRGSWKGTFLRWGLVGGAIYYYNTATVFAEESVRQDLQQRIHELPIGVSGQEEEGEERHLPTLDEISAARQQRLAAASASSPETSSDGASSASKTTTKTRSAAAAAASIPENDAPSLSTDSPALSHATSQAAVQQQGAAGAVDEHGNDNDGAVLGLGGPADLEEEAGQQGAFNEETGEINWDCPCLGGMAHGPCGPEFREAFSCFVYSKEEPKGIDCIDKFKGMQECFREYPEIYGAELAEEDDPSMEAGLPDDMPGDGSADDGDHEAKGSPAAARQSSSSQSDNVSTRAASGKTEAKSTQERR